MSAKKTLEVREKELQAMLTTAKGRAQLQELKEKYESDAERLSPVGKSIISFIIVSEREMGFIEK